MMMFFSRTESLGTFASVQTTFSSFSISTPLEKEAASKAVEALKKIEVK